jgi:hypothetical protein
MLEAHEMPAQNDSTPPYPNTQATTFTVGQLYVHAMSSAYPKTIEKWYWGLGPAPLTGRLLAPIHPRKESLIGWPPTALNDRSAEDIAAAFHRYTDAISTSIVGRRLF